MEVDIGIIGLGHMGKNHARVCSMVKNIKLAGVTDIIPQRAKQISSQFEVKAYNNYHEMLGKVNAVIIATQTAYHYEITKFFLKNGVHVLVEKPITINIEHAIELMNISKENNLKLAVGHIERFNPAYRVLKNILKNEKLITVEINRMSHWEERVKDIDVVMDLMIHDIDLITDLIGEDVINIFSIGRKVIAGSNYLDYVTAILKFPCGIFGKLTASRITEQKIREIKINAVNKYYHVDLLKKDFNIYSRTKLTESNISNPTYIQENIVEKVHIPNSEALYDEICDFRDSILFDKELIVPGEDGVKALSTVTNIIDQLKHTN